MTDQQLAVAEILAEYESGKHYECEIEHTSDCDRHHAEWKVAHTAYLKRWPDVCMSCGGVGGFEYQDDPGVNYCSLSGGTMPFYEPCETCFCEGICPRCGKIAWPDEDYDPDVPCVCPHCGWIENSTPGLPPAPECYCWLNQ